MSTGPTEETVKEVFVRDEGCCAWCGEPITGRRSFDWSVHHRRPRGSGGTSVEWVNSAANLVLLCGSGTTGCHGHIESHRTEGYDTGFLVSQNGIHAAMDTPIRHHIHGRVYLCEDGTTTAEIRQPVLSSTERKES